MSEPLAIARSSDGTMASTKRIMRSIEWMDGWMDDPYAASRSIDRPLNCVCPDWALEKRCNIYMLLPATSARRRARALLALKCDGRWTVACVCACCCVCWLACRSAFNQWE